MNAPKITENDIKKIVLDAEILKEFRTSGQKQVFLCSPDIVIKFIHLGKTDSIDDVSLGRVQREIEIINKLKSPYLPKAGSVAPGYYKKGDEVFFYYSEQYINGKDLRDIINEKPLTGEQAELLLKHITEAVSVLFKSGIIHRDIKPENIILDDNGHFILIDAGAALAQNESTLTPEGFIIGTLIYMSPEQIKGKRHELDSRSDQYSLGVVAYEALTGKHPYWVSGMPKSEIYKRVCIENSKTLASLKLDANSKIIYAIDKMMSKAPHMRFRSCEKLLEKIS